MNNLTVKLLSIESVKKFTTKLLVGKICQ